MILFVFSEKIYIVEFTKSLEVKILRFAIIAAVILMMLDAFNYAVELWKSGNRFGSVGIFGFISLNIALTIFSVFLRQYV